MDAPTLVLTRILFFGIALTSVAGYTFFRVLAAREVGKATGEGTLAVLGSRWLTVPSESQSLRMYRRLAVGFFLGGTLLTLALMAWIVLRGGEQAH